MIELVGDTSRLTVIENAIKEVFSEHQNLSRTLNSQEYLARGATIIAAQLARNPKAHDYKIFDYQEEESQEDDQNIFNLL